MKDKTKIWLLSTILLVGCALLVFGIGRMLYKDPVRTLAKEGTDATSEEVTTEISNEDPELIEISEKDVEVTVMDASGLEISDVIPAEDEQKIQDDAVIPDPPEETPELKDGEDPTNREKAPEYKEQTPERKPDESPIVTVPEDNNGHEGEVYVEGFGWIKDSGIPNKIIYAPEMYLSGEKVGDM
ncbi:MAG: hypothetical protein IKN45_09300 [Lachnospiraceae bacterium]|nr:hypothetical protein [Lachnospiraceae bacterium]